MTNYIQSYYDGSLFQYSKEEKEGYKEHTNSKGKVTYRKYYNTGVEGELVSIQLRKNEYLNNREELRLKLNDVGEEYVVDFPVLNNNGDEIDDFVESIVRQLPNMNKGERYNINNWRLNKGDVINDEVVQYTNSGVTIKKDGEKIGYKLTYVTDNNPKGDIPKLEWKEIAGKNRPTAASKEAKLVFLYDTLKKEVERLGTSNNTSTAKPSTSSKPSNQVPTATPQEAFEPVSDLNEDDHDDLPF